MSHHLTPGQKVWAAASAPRMTISPSAPKRRWDPWPVSIIAFFTVAITGLVAFIVFCSRHPSDLVAENYYDQEVRYQGQMDRMQRARQSLEPTRISYDASAGVILVQFPARAVSAEITGKIQLYRPSSAKLDRELTLQPDVNGVQKIEARTLAPGLWQVRLSWTARNQEFYQDQKIVIRGTNES